MDELRQLAIAGLVHDLPALFKTADIQLSPNAEKIVNLGKSDQPGLAEILERAERLTLPQEGDRTLASDQPLISIFSRLNLHTLEEPEPFFHKISPLQSTEESQDYLFPSRGENSFNISSHVSELAGELDWLGTDVDIDQGDGLYHHLLSLLNRYAWCLAGHEADVSLFDHARLASAVAVCLSLFENQASTPEISAQDPDAQPFMLIAGDLSGIQKYIFDITTIGAGGVARRLRSRSFFISALSDVVSHQLALRFGLPLGNILMSSGGKFYLLAPNLYAAEDMLAGFRRDIDRWFVEQFNGEIALNLAHSTFSGEHLQASSMDKRGFGDVLADLSLRLNREKFKRGQTVLLREGEWDESAFLIARDFWGVGICASCGKFPGDRPEGICEQCERDRQIGRILPAARYVAYYQHAQEDPGWMPMPLEFSVRVLREEDLGRAGQPYLITKLNDPDIRELADYNAAFRYLANYVPLQDHGGQMSFDEIAGSAQGRKLLGYVKADVDYLGMLFAHGLRREAGGYDTGTHLAALSRELDLFFSGWMQHLLSGAEGFQNFYTIFSGGDDLFLVGPWNRAADLASKIYERFVTFVGENQDITLSAGLLFTKDRYPISRAADDAERMLELSKEKSYQDPEGTTRKRNQLTILGDTFPWKVAPQIFEQIELLKPRLDELKSSFLYRLAEYGQLYRLWAEEGKIEGLRYKPMFAYNIARNLRKQDRQLYEWADELMQSLHGGNANVAMQHLSMIATYLQFLKRES